MIYIDKQNHQYVKNGEVYNSVSSLLTNYKQPFNSEYWGLRKAYELYIIDKEGFTGEDSTKTKKAKAHISKIMDQVVSEIACPFDLDAPKKEDIDFLNHILKVQNVDMEKLEVFKSSISDLWDDKRITASNKGNAYHRDREIKAIRTGVEVNAFDALDYPLHLDLLKKSYPPLNDPSLSLEEELILNLDNSNIKYAISEDYFNDLLDGYYPELIIWNDKYKLAGTSDKIFISSFPKLGMRVVDVDDFKTNAVIQKKSFYNRATGYKMMKYPLDHLMDCKHVHYHLQVSIYGWMLEQMGFEVRNVGYHHINFLNILPYLKEEVEVLLNHYASTQSNFDKFDFNNL